MVHQHPCIKAMMRACADGLKISFPTLIKYLTVMSYKGIDLPLKVVGLMSTEELLQEFRLQLSPVPSGPWLNELSQILALSLSVNGKAFLECSANLLEIPNMRVWIFVFHTMKGWE